jgi:hypothetical protein
MLDLKLAAENGTADVLDIPMRRTDEHYFLVIDASRDCNQIDPRKAAKTEV